MGSLTATGILIEIFLQTPAAFSPSSTVIMVGHQKLGLFRNVVVVATVVGATASASPFIEENSVSPVTAAAVSSEGYSSFVVSFRYLQFFC